MYLSTDNFCFILTLVLFDELLLDVVGNELIAGKLRREGGTATGQRPE